VVERLTGAMGIGWSSLGRSLLGCLLLRSHLRGKCHLGRLSLSRALCWCRWLLTGKLEARPKALRGDLSKVVVYRPLMYAT